MPANFLLQRKKSCVKVLIEILGKKVLHISAEESCVIRQRETERCNTVGYRYYINYFQKNEYVKHDERLTPMPLGTLLLSVIDRDWAGLAAEVSEQRRRIYRMDQVPECVEHIREEFANTHIFLQRELERQLSTGDGLYSVFRWATELEKFKSRLCSLITRVLDLDGTDSDLTTVQRYYLLNHTDPEARRFKQQMHAELKVLQCMMSGHTDEEFTVTRENIADLELEAAICYASDDLRALVFMEFEFMVTYGFGLRRCDNCGKYFLPFSVVSRYCDRPAGNGKVCKDLAVRDRYNRKLQENIFRSAYVKNNNAYQMRVRRSPEQYPAEEYARWKENARLALSGLADGTVSETECMKLVSLPDRRQQETPAQ